MNLLIADGIAHDRLTKGFDVYLNIRIVYDLIAKMFHCPRKNIIYILVGRRNLSINRFS